MHTYLLCITTDLPMIASTTVLAHIPSSTSYGVNRKVRLSNYHIRHDKWENGRDPLREQTYLPHKLHWASAFSQTNQ